jgi:hypothetical protein
MKLEYDSISPITKNLCVLSEPDDTTGVMSYMCMESGYVTTDQLIEGSQQIEEFEKGITTLMRQIKFTDPETKLVWYPAFLRSPYAMLFCTGTNEHDMLWQVAKVVDLPKELRAQVPGKEGEYYTSMIDTANATSYDKALFENALDLFYEIIFKETQTDPIELNQDEN